MAYRYATKDMKLIQSNFKHVIELVPNKQSTRSRARVHTFNFRYIWLHVLNMISNKNTPHEWTKIIPNIKCAKCFIWCLCNEICWSDAVGVCIVHINKIDRKSRTDTNSLPLSPTLCFQSYRGHFTFSHGFSTLLQSSCFARIELDHFAIVFSMLTFPWSVKHYAITDESETSDDLYRSCMNINKIFTVERNIWWDT